MLHLGFLILGAIIISSFVANGVGVDPQARFFRTGGVQRRGWPSSHFCFSGWRP
jgi:hypothetical protein